MIDSGAMWSGIILDELRQAAIRYTEAALDSTSPAVQRCFERLARDAANRHELLQAIMLQNRLLEPDAAASAGDVDRAADRAAAMAQSLRRSARRGPTPTPSPGPSPAQAASAGGFPTGMPVPGASLYASAPRPPEFALPRQGAFGGMPAAAYAAQPWTQPVTWRGEETPPRAARVEEANPPAEEQAAAMPDPPEQAAQPKRGRRPKAQKEPAAEQEQGFAPQPQLDEPERPAAT